MAISALAAQSPTSHSLSPTFTAANVDGHSLAFSRTGFLHVKNGTGGLGASITVTVTTAITVDGLAVGDRTYTVSNTGTAEKLIWFNGATDRQVSGADKGKVYVTFSSVTSITCAYIDGGVN